MSDENKGLNFLFGVFLGSLIGASVAILLTPQSGEKTRDYLREKFAEGKEKAQDLAQDLKENVEELMEKSKKIVQENKNFWSNITKSEPGEELS
ncbi:MAG: YtxH domain-containing protein [Armatimonadetes bacterium]|nr:YtxH domain-containing protein [Armatimonadota bacterium]